ncbi:aminotransferase class IV [Cecembia lonarensis]|uniref:branched-chain-amino-acid transaminase n=1 Tax=Cecembia lonarensis (strain CCUG 58316 / KCTC 22772 / LW9) TaxID=1225176 RepID=K1L1A6_CECL9|nr:aminotransferase class IV [Cecembia lonarensis]EKB50170.1 D-alanine aminotransferase [Cecembia lonarensis LW9]
MKPFCFANDRIIASDKATLHPMDIGLIRGYGIFDFFRTAHHTPLFLSDYLDRFIRSAEKTHLKLDLNKEELAQIVHDLISRNDLEFGGVRMVLTGGVSENHFSPTAGQLFIFCEALDFPAPSKYESGIKLLAVEHIRAIADIKTTNYAFPVWHSAIWKKEGADDVLYHLNGQVSESSRSNIFVIKDGEIATPNKHILHGITRKRVLELIPQTEIKAISLEEVLRADELFITSTTKKVLPVTQIDNNKIGSGKPGPITQKLMQDFAIMEKENLQKV